MSKIIRRVTSLMVLILMLALVVVGCGDNDSKQGNQPIKNDSSQQQELTENKEKAKEEQLGQEEKKESGEKQLTAENTQKAVANGQTSQEKAVAQGETKQAVGSVLIIEGSGVAKTTQLSLADLKTMSIIQDQYFSLNNWGTKEYFSFKGVALWEILTKAGVKDSAQQVVLTSEDGYSVTYSIADVKKDDYIDEQNPAKKYKMIIAWEENGKAYDATHYPFRLAVGQKAPGDINKPNWVEKVKTIKVN